MDEDDDLDSLASIEESDDEEEAEAETAEEQPEAVEEEKDNSDSVIEPLLQTQNKLADLLEIAAEVVTNASHVDATRMRQNSALCLKYVQLVQEIRTSLEQKINEMPEELPFKRISYEQYQNFLISARKTAIIQARIKELSTFCQQQPSS
eukprot:TRINITY_DN14126_c0_g1_i4.p1 TRINITY_DN14126_c0_g1~~TRINITY_DN14126_c0_g1_i4.p1  ORF type:complete len:172 (+),score=31.22 TRINITY_DN14126_c0_g1_i4:68-517(+)